MTSWLLTWWTELIKRVQNISNYSDVWHVRHVTSVIMGLISDRKAKKQKEKELEKLKNAQNRALSPLKKTGGGVGMGGPMMVGRYPAGYYTTPAPQSSSWSHAHHGGHHGQQHPGQPRQQANVNPRYQTWVAPRKQQPHLGQLVRTDNIMTISDTNVISKWEDMDNNRWLDWVREWGMFLNTFFCCAVKYIKWWCQKSGHDEDMKVWMRDVMIKWKRVLESLILAATFSWVQSPDNTSSDPDDCSGSCLPQMFAKCLHFSSIKINCASCHQCRLNGCFREIFSAGF